MEERSGFRWILLCVWCASAPFPARSGQPRLLRDDGSVETSTLYVQVTRRHTRHPVCVTAQEALPACLPLPEHDVQQYSQPSGRDVQPSAPLRILHTTKILLEETALELEASYRHPRYLQFGVPTPVATDSPRPVISTEPLTEEVSTGQNQSHRNLTIVTLTITQVEDIMDTRVTATLQAKNCVPVGSKIPFCDQTSVHSPLPHHQELSTNLKEWTLFGIRLPWPSDFNSGSDKQESTSAEEHLEQVNTPFAETVDTKMITKSLEEPTVMKTSSQDNHRGDNIEPPRDEDAKAIVQLSSIDPAIVTVSTNSPGEQYAKNHFPNYNQSEKQLVSLLALDEQVLQQSPTVDPAGVTVFNNSPGENHFMKHYLEYIHKKDKAIAFVDQRNS